MLKTKIVILLISAFILLPTRAGELPPIVVSTQGQRIDEQVLVTANHGIIFPREKVDKRWEEGYYITSSCYSSAGWAIVMSQTDRWSNQTYKVSTDWPDQWIQERRALGYFITSVASDGKNWITALTSGTGITDQWAATLPWDMLLELIVEQSESGWMVTSLAFNDGLWTVVMSLGTSYKNQLYEYATSSADIATKVSAAKEHGYILTTVAADTSRYILIFSRMADGTVPVQNVTQVTESTRQLFKAERQNGMEVQFIGG